MRLDKFVCKSTEFSKAKAVQVIQRGEVVVNGAAALDPSIQVHENNTILLNGDTLTPRPFRYIMMHKPAATVCSNIDEVYPSVFNYLSIDRPEELHIAGRLDSDTTGLLLITDDGRWSFNITQPNRGCCKVYRVQLSKAIAEDVIERFAEGVQLQGEAAPTLPATLEIIHDKEALLTLKEGKFHQVKRMFAAVGNRVIGLHRERIGEVTLDVSECGWRYLTSDEVSSFSR